MYLSGANWDFKDMMLPGCAPESKPTWVLITRSSLYIHKYATHAKASVVICKLRSEVSGEPHCADTSPALGRALLLSFKTVLCKQRRASGRAELCSRNQDGKVSLHGWKAGAGAWI
uniref:Uncharacterized protein n=1 Tax=Mus spicilegus TaxID=10103 RepID=A0A8C6MYI4_MUSSI